MSNLAYELDTLYTYEDYLYWDVSERYEIIDGVAYAMASPTATHQRILRELFVLIYDFLKDKPCEVFAAPFDVRLFPEEDNSDTTVVQPDILVICDPSKLSDGKACKGAPNLVIEILSASSVIMDRKVKAEKYRNAGVPEYWIVNADSLEILLNLLEGGRYTAKVYKDRVPSSVLPGMVIDLHAVRARIGSAGVPVAP
jgi:Uma2 family endonuclease